MEYLKVDTFLFQFFDLLLAHDVTLGLVRENQGHLDTIVGEYRGLGNGE